MSLRRPARLRSFDYVGRYAYFVTFCTHDRAVVFGAPPEYECVRSEILRTCAERAFAVPAGVFMPDHIHLVVRGLEEKSQFKSCMKVGRQRSAVAYRATFGHRLWQEGYVDHVIRDADDERRVVRYIANNPVRAGLSPSADEYPYSWFEGKK